MINATGNRMTREIARQSWLAQDIAQTQIQVSTGKRLQRASDDPVAANRVSTLQTVQANGVAWKANVDLGVTLTAQADSVLQSATDLLVRARELTVAGANQTLAPADRNAIATELSALAYELDGLASTSSTLGEPLFATGAPRMIRFDSDALFAPVPSRAALFDSGGQSAAQHVRDAASAISSGNAASIGSSMTALDGAIDQIATAQAQIGINATRLERLTELQAERKIANKAERSALEDTDLTSAIAKLNAQTITLEAAQAAFARINRRTLFDILG
ncbi:flagellin-like protein [Sphingorhabdus pulchriflava]|uniref:Flagellin n=1 Tax=Sphingorhabdus pulchriflava TaxID=2292257 RepID=A0A371B574_9SPHN|nr:flagellin [Sphingorhabdus pulchriflava]RDV02662.1 flagellin-like protein [Sphingorhabdus pulchriflava]